ncbi:hypothetical protein BOX37_13165 [Nocardia mangyaensis]|uniref:Uncharacterized protein n=1 Tax=Nocardia mangyaensis TaxID=2213200 RepID=A0A1J0VRS9_9NOCA|nr:hypothetical protein BOX37_13165 [Nocardia mangyaensis]
MTFMLSGFTAVRIKPFTTPTPALHTGEQAEPPEIDLHLRPGFTISDRRRRALPSEPQFRCRVTIQSRGGCTTRWQVGMMLLFMSTGGEPAAVACR